MPTPGDAQGRRVRLRPMTSEEFDVWQEASVRSYAQAKVGAGSWPEAGAVDRARDQLRALLPDGAGTAGMLLRVAEDAADGTRVGTACVGLSGPQREDEAFGYDLEVEPGHRGQGWGRAVVRAVEDELRGAGVRAVSLNVFGPNHVARGLYESEGWAVVATQMRLEL